MSETFQAMRAVPMGRNTDRPVSPAQSSNLIEKANGTINELAACGELLEAIISRLEPLIPTKDGNGPVAPSPNDLSTLLNEAGGRASVLNMRLRYLAGIIGA